ncbi:LOW QUALITY PROTEIN: hypothetical protein PHMEG_00015246 [Phytophthora megakarya]|uniref:Uncharacterized protein n=1 Tax=Phytophthora megakarya TaxID=4795 RepID=A0A225W1R9_9STRA|nr:LOW QUALITY PROTEIN: hypothetical protein PHMEG_00015246 [Phytophthora megakarya]
MANKIREYAVKLEIAGSTYSIFPVVHVSKFKPVRMFPDRPVALLAGSDIELISTKLSYRIQDRDPNEYEVDRISDMRTENFWYAGGDMKILLEWMKQISTTALLYEFLRDRTNRNRFGVMQSHEEP